MLEEATASLVVASFAQGFEVSIAPTRGIGEGAELAPWVCEWLQMWLLTLSEESRTDNDHTFLYVLFDPSGREPNGLVDGQGVLEMGYGSDPVGPPSGKSRSLEALVRAVCV
jgi:hypothetical protein